ncbi:MAG: diacylglycerol/lipid kinase family protein [Emergencia sp.]
MKHYFFVNPAAGQGKGTEKLIAEIEAAAGELQTEYEIYVTKGIGDGERRAGEIAEGLKGQPARFYACGGDGTFNEIINGIAGKPGIAAGCIPTGTGNDMVRNFPQAGDFMSPRSQMLGQTETVDLIRYAGVIDGTYQQRYCANMFNIGLDCNVVELAGRLKKKPFIAGSMAYLLAVAGIFIQKKCIGLHLEEEGEVLVDGDVLLCAIANGSYCGGGMHTAPQSVLNDGLFDLNIISDVSRLTFLKLFPKYQAGTHLQVPGIEEIVRVRKCRKLSLRPLKESFFLCADGEISVAEAVEFEMAPGALEFVIPAREQSAER